MISKISLKNLIINTIIGVYTQEKITPQKLIFNITIDYDFSHAADDNLENTINYANLEEQIISFIKKTKFNLLERLALELAAFIKTNFGYNKISQVSIEIIKPEAIGMKSTPSIFLEI